MGTEAVVYFDSTLMLHELDAVPGRLLAECPAVAEVVDCWSEPFGWRLDGKREAGFDCDLAAELWMSHREIRLFCPVGHLGFREHSVRWDSFVKWAWLEDEADRDHLVGVATQLSRVVGATFGLVSPDGGADDDIDDVLDAGGSVADAYVRVGRAACKPVPLAGAPFVPSAYYSLRFD
jgi:hypothetical protein